MRHSQGNRIHSPLPTFPPSPCTLSLLPFTPSIPSVDRIRYLSIFISHHIGKGIPILIDLLQQYTQGHIRSISTTTTSSHINNTPYTMSAPDYKANPSIDGTTVNNGQAGNGARNGKASSPTNSEDLNRYVTDDTPRPKRAEAPLPGVMVCHLYVPVKAFTNIQTVQPLRKNEYVYVAEIADNANRPECNLPMHRTWVLAVSRYVLIHW